MSLLLSHVPFPVRLSRSTMLPSHTRSPFPALSLTSLLLLLLPLLLLLVMLPLPQLLLVLLVLLLLPLLLPLLAMLELLLPQPLLPSTKFFSSKVANSTEVATSNQTTGCATQSDCLPVHCSNCFCSEGSFSLSFSGLATLIPL